MYNFAVQVICKDLHILSLQPVLPLITSEDVNCQEPVRHRVRHYAVGQTARPNHPPVVEDAGEQTYVPIGTVLGPEKDGGDPERVVRVRSQPDGLKVFRADEPAHQPATPEELLHDGHQRHGAEHSKDYEDQTLLGGRCDRALSRADQEVVEEPMMSISWPKHVWSDPEHEHREAHQ